MYVFNTMTEDQWMARALNGWDANDEVEVDDLDILDASTRRRFSCLQAMLFSSSMGHQNLTYNLLTKALEICMARVIKFENFNLK